MKWIPDNISIIVDSPILPTATLVSVDLEYSEHEVSDREFSLVCIGLYDGTSYYVWFNITDQVIEYLRNVNWLCVDGIHAELKVLNHLYGGFKAEQIQYDVKIMGYVFDSAAKDWSLKGMAKRYLGVERPTYSQLKKEYKFKSIKELPQEVLIDYNGADCVDTFNLWNYFRKHFNSGHWNFYNTIELPTNHLLAKIEDKGILVDKTEVRRIHNETSKKRRQASKSLFQIAGKVFNPNSPKQVLPILHSSGAKCRTTAEDEIKRYGTNPFVQALLEYRGLQKLTSTYTIPLYTEAIKALDGRIRARFGQNTLTGRLSSSDPINLQNQPASIRSCFVAKEGHSFIEADWSNLEWRIPGHFSGDPAIIEELSKPDGDIHLQTARLMFGQTITDRERKIAKTCNFLLTNSGRAKRLAAELGCSYSEAESIYNKFWAGYKVLGEWTKSTKESAKANGGISTLFGRFVSLPALQAWCGRPNCPVVAKDYFCKECFKREETEREAVSVKVQGTGADLIKLAMLRLHREYGYVPVLTVHDSVLMEVEDSKIEEVSKNIKYVMENLVDFKVPLYVELGVGKSWAQTKG